MVAETLERESVQGPIDQVQQYDLINTTTRDSPEPDFAPPDITPPNSPSPVSPNMQNQNNPLASFSVSDVILGYSLRHKLSDTAVTDLIEMLKVLGTPNVPRNIRQIFSFEQAKTFFFCSCLDCRPTAFSCQTCGESNNFFYLPCFETNCFRIVRRHFSSGVSLDMSLYTDGVSTFVSSKYSLWPIYMVFNDLDISVRYKLNNILICGIWYGKVKPPMQKLIELCFTPHLEKFNSCFIIENFSFTLHIKFLIADKPARAMLLNFQSSNARYFCPLCTATTVTSTVDNRRHVFVPLSMENVEERTKEWFTTCAYSATESGVPEYGIKGYCFLQNIQSFDVVKSNIFDYMHSICLGVFKSLINLLFFASSSMNFFRRQTAQFDRTIKSIKFPSQIVKSAPLLSNHGLWQAKDYRNFFLFVFPILFDGDNSAPVQCVMTLRRGMLLVLGPLNDSVLTNCKNDFENFLLSFKNLFGEHHVTPNFHDLVHLPDMAKSCNSITGFSGFNFEHINGRLARLCHGNKRFDIQIARKLDAIMSIEHPDQNDSSPFAVFLKSLHSGKKWKCSFFINSQVQIVGKTRRLHNVSDSLQSLFSGATVYFSSRMILNSKKISVASYDASKKFSNSSFISSDFSTFLSLENIYFQKTESLRCFLEVKIFDLIQNDLSIFSIIGEGRTECLPAENFLENNLFCLKHGNAVIAVPKLEYY